MAISTWSAFLYNFEVTEDNLSLPFDEGSGEVIAQVTPGSYAPTRGLLRVGDAMSSVGSQTYSVALDRSTRLVTISSTNPFDLLVSSGSPANVIWPLLGFSGSDRTGSNIYTGNMPVCDFYEPQFKLQDYISPDHYKRSIDQTVKKTADGSVEVVRFGVERMIQMNIKYITDKMMDGITIKNNPSGVADAIDFLDFITTKSQFEFMPDIDLPSSFLTVILESTPGVSDGTGFTLTELYDRNLPDFYETGRLMLRVIS